MSGKSKFIIGTSLALVTLTIAISQDEGVKRSMQFWVGVAPIYAHYRFVQFSTRNDSPEVVSEAFNKLHDRYAPVVKALTLKMQGFYLKQAQLVSVLDDFVPPQYMKWCKEMQSEVPSFFEGDEAARVIEESLGIKIEDVFEYFEMKPVGCASIGQVHRARLKNGQEVAIKIQQPGIESMFKSDMKTCMQFCRLALPQYVAPLKETEKQFLTEFDYILEAENLEKIAKNIMPKWGDQVAVPLPVKEYCTKTILVMEYLHGIKLVDGIMRDFRTYAEFTQQSMDDLEKEMKRKIENREFSDITSQKRQMRIGKFYYRVKDTVFNMPKFIYNWTFGLFLETYNYTWTPALPDLASVLELLINVHAHEIFIDGEFNGDPHPGNILLMDDGRIGLIDYGQVKRLDTKDRISYAKYILAIADDDKQRIIDIWLNDFGSSSKYNNPDVIYKLSCFWNDRFTEDITMGKNLQEFIDWAEATDPAVNINEEIVMPARVSVMLRGMGNAFGLQIKTARYYKPYAEEYLKSINESF